MASTVSFASPKIIALFSLKNSGFCTPALPLVWWHETGSTSLRPWWWALTVPPSMVPVPGGGVYGDAPPLSPLGYSPILLPSQRLCVCRHARLHTWKSTAKPQSVHTEKGSPHQNSSCLTDCAQLFLRAPVWSEQDPRWHPSALSEGLVILDSSAQRNVAGGY